MTAIQKYLSKLGKKGGSVSSPAKREAALAREAAKRCRKILQEQNRVVTNEINGALAVVNPSDKPVTVSDSQA